MSEVQTVGAPPGMLYPQIAQWSLERYRRELLVERPSLSHYAQEALDRLVETIEAAVDRPKTLRPEEISFGITSLANTPQGELPAFINQYSLGVGWDGASVVVMGTEPAENPESPEDMAWHAIYSVLVGAESRPEIVDRIAEGSNWKTSAGKEWNPGGRRPYHLNPNDFIHVERRRGTSTWKVVAQVVAPKSAGEWRQLLDGKPDSPGLGHYAYQIDRSAIPAMESAKGEPPSDKRIAFLAEVLQLLRKTARLLLLHGFGGPGRWREWWQQDERVIRAFLGLKSTAKVDLDWRNAAGSNSLGVLSDGGRKVVYTRALSNRVTPAYIEAVRHEVHFDMSEMS